jgi:hypothetical protein
MPPFGHRRGGELINRPAIGLVFSLLFGSTAVPTHAQVAPSRSAVEPAEVCELHVWPAPEYATHFFGIFPPGSVIGELEMPNARQVLQPGGQGVVEAWLSPEFIVRTIESADLRAFFGRTVRVIPHFTTRREASSILRARTRSTSSTVPCYYELHVRMIYLQRAALTGTRFMVAWRLKTFPPQNGRPSVATSAAIQVLRGFRVDRPVDEVRRDIEAAFSRSLDTFIRGALDGTIR